MKPQTFTEKQLRWDLFRQFHVIHYIHMDGIRVAQMTETGEYLVSVQTLTGDLPLAHRHAHAWAGFEVWRVTDRELYRRFDLHTPGGERVKAAWLDEGRSSQLLLCDTTCDRAVLLHHPRSLWGTYKLDVDARPTWAQQYGGVYYNTATDVPQPAGPVLFDMPTHQTVEQKRHVRALKEAAEAWKVLTADEVQYVGTTAITFRKGSAMDEAWASLEVHGTTYPRPFVRSGGLYPSELYGKTLGDLTYQQLATLAYRGVARETTVRHLPYLTLTRQG